MVSDYIKNAPLSMSKAQALCLMNTWMEKPAKGEMDDKYWDIYAVSAEMILAEDLNMAYYWPIICEDSRHIDFWMGIEDETDDIAYAIESMSLTDDELRIFCGIHVLIFKIYSTSNLERTNQQIISEIEGKMEGVFAFVEDNEESDEEFDTEDDSKDVPRDAERRLREGYQ